MPRTNVWICMVLILLGVSLAEENATCLTGSVPFLLGSDCPPGFYCPFLPSPPTFCSPTQNCSIDRLAAKFCEPQGTTEPTICPKGYFCRTPLTKEKCPSGYFCKTGTHIPEKCPPLSFCGEGFFRARYLGGILICALLDLALLLVYLTFSRNALILRLAPLIPSFFRLYHPTPIHPHQEGDKELKEKAKSHVEINMGGMGEKGVVSWGLVEGFSRANGGRGVSLRFDFEDLSIRLPTGQSILQGVSGAIRPGRVTAIMGPSGAGKTTFMNCLMGKVARTGGNLHINGTELEIHKLRKVIGYVPQDDIMLNELTVKENISHSARIRLPRTWTYAETSHFVDAVLEALDLSLVASTVVGDHLRRGISGGQRKRTNIGMELAAAPLAIFLDEPTSGLDSTAALKVAEILRDMAQLGLTVVAVIHQPRHEIFELFDDILMVAPGGVTAYLGPQSNVVEHFAGMGFLFDKYSNQADQLMDILSGKGAKVSGEPYTVQEILDYWRTSPTRREVKEANKEEIESKGASAADPQSLKIIKTMGKERGGNWVIQTVLCHNRSIVQQLRLIPALVLEIGVALLAGFLMGLATGNGDMEIYQGVLIAPFTLLSPTPIEWGIPLYGLLIGMSIGLAGGPAGVKTFGEERHVYFREAAAGHNRFTYFLGKTVSVIYRQILSALHFTTIYTLLAAPLTPFPRMFAIVFVFFFCVYGLASVVSMLVRRENAPLLGVVTCLFAAVFCGFGPSLKNVSDWGIGWLWDLCYARWLTEAFYTEEVLPFEGVFEVHSVSEAQFGFTLGRFGLDCGIAVVIGCVLRVVAFVLMVALNRKQQK